MSDREEAPVTAIFHMRLELEDALARGSWDECANLAKGICKQIKLAMNPATAKTGTVHLDGVYCVGTMHYQSAADKAKKALNKMNRIIRTAKGTIK